jgi:Type VI secretion system/phage-baseplate injector OB domain
MTSDKRFYGIYQGICTDNIDPDNKYKIKAQVPQVLGSAIADVVYPCRKPAATEVPEINEIVWIMFIAGDPNFPVWMGVM